jgi:hypothetical protein
MFDRRVNFVTKTSGDGYWSIQIKTVRINRVELAYVNEEGTFGELRAYFDTGDWDIDNDGLIYSDMGWKHSFLTCMENYFSLSADAILDLSYSEQGMQGVDYVSMDVGPQFILECGALYRFAVHKEAVNQGA